MVIIDPEFVVPAVPEEDQYEGTEIDENVLKALPPGLTIEWAATSGASFWAFNSKIDTILPDGSEQSYFLKVYTTERAGDIARGEYEGLKALRAVIPENIPNPVAWGLCARDPSRSFFIAEFRYLDDDLPAMSELVDLVGQLHGGQTSPNGKFGFHTTTFCGRLPNDNRWCDTWEEYFTRNIRELMSIELATHGPHEELERLSAIVLDKVIPRLLRPMETEGRSIRPTLVHGDLWHGNVSIDAETMEPVLYDPGCFYGHHEYDFSMWRAARYRTSQAHVKCYFDKFGASEPTEDKDGRNMLYAMRSDLAVSVLWSANKAIRELAIEGMRRLVAEYGEGYDGYLARRAGGGLVESQAGEHTAAAPGANAVQPRVIAAVPIPAVGV